MILTLLLFLPVVSCLFWMLIHTLMASRTESFWTITALLTAATLYLITDLIYSGPLSSPDLLTKGALIAQLACPSFIPLIIQYTNRLTNKNAARKPYEYLWAILPAAMFTGAFVLYTVCGVNEINRFNEEYSALGIDALDRYKGTLVYSYYLWTEILYRIVLGGELVIIAIYITTIGNKEKFRFRNIGDFLKKGKPINFVELQLFSIILCTIVIAPKIFPSRQIILEHPWITVVWSMLILVTISIFAYIALFSSKERITLKEMKYAFRYNYTSKEKEDVIEEMVAEMIGEAEDDALERIKERLNEERRREEAAEVHAEAKKEENVHQTVENLFAAMSGTWDENSLMSRLQKLLVEEKLFLQPKLTLNDVADRLHTNKTYISKLVNNTYNLGFPELINTMRIDYAEQYILANRDAKQDKIAEECGFLSASSFNIMFKKITGMTPKVWIATLDKQQNRG